MKNNHGISPDSIDETRQHISLGWVIIAIAAILFLVLPVFLKDPYFIHVIIIVFLFGFLATGWSILGMTGQLSLGHAAFFGIGGYTSTLLFLQLGLSPWLGMFIGAIASGILGVIVGYPALRLRGPYFALTSIAMAEILRIYVENTEIGPFGIPLKAGMGLLVPLKGNRPEIFQFDGKIPYYYIAFGFLCASVIVSFFINRTRMGYYFAAIRNDQDASESLGVNPTKYKLIAMFISCVILALGGTFYAQYFRYINPGRAMDVSLSLEIALVGIVGGWQTVLGPTIGAILLSPLGEIIRAYFGSSYIGLHLILYGIMLMVVILFLPKGLNDPIRGLIKKIENKFLSNW